MSGLNFHQYWDVNSTPKVYLMDKDKKIIAKSLGAEQLEDLLNRLENGSDTSAPLKETEYEDEDEAFDRIKAKIHEYNFERPNAGNGGFSPNSVHVQGRYAMMMRRKRARQTTADRRRIYWTNV